jgi:hypothetical protein
MRIVRPILIVLASVALCGCSGGRGGLWCAHYGTGLNDCSFYSFEQCRASLSGNGGSCARNPFAAPGSVQR